MFKDFISNYQSEYISTLENLEQNSLTELLSLVENAMIKGQNVFVLGNGGSSASASHWVCDFNKGVGLEKRELKARFISLTDNVPVMTAYGNDISYSKVFVEQLKNLIRKDDLVISLSVSGNSENLVLAQNYAKDQGNKTVCITNNQGNLLRESADLMISVPSENYGIVEDVHMYICHVLSQYIAQK
ncbi:SIS domain-containing protein [Carnobacterium funditum]|uniref:SIS domain-containing protein n=1 Tax=Carnobacterium funditum TaxID=2752 RepID=UPI000690B689|nr:SIS domain-containing protein [Carnobacterium funditum]